MRTGRSLALDESIDEIVGPELADSLGLAFLLVAEQPVSGDVAMAESRGGRIWFLRQGDRSPVGYGTAGNAPGELSAPIQLLFSGSELVVAENGGGRFSFWSVDSGYLGAVQVPTTAREFDVTGESSIVMATGSGDSYFLEIQPDDDIIGHGVVSSLRSAKRRTLDDLAVDRASGSIVYFSNADLVVDVFHLGREQPVTRWRVPDEIARVIRESQRKSAEDFGGGFDPERYGALRNWSARPEGGILMRSVPQLGRLFIVHADSGRIDEVLAPNARIQAVVDSAYRIVAAADGVLASFADGRVVRLRYAR